MIESNFMQAWVTLAGSLTMIALLLTAFGLMLGIMKPADALRRVGAIMCNHEEAVQNAEGQRRHGEEVHRGDGLMVITQESSPSLCRLGISLIIQPRKLGLSPPLGFL